MITRGLLSLLLLAGSAQADSLRCHLDYGGETRQIDSPPLASPYAASTHKIGSFFLFRPVYQTEPADLAGIRLYVYANRDSGPALLHQASFAVDAPAAAVNGFSGRHFVYEPLRDGELQYWCEIKHDEAAK